MGKRSKWTFLTNHSHVLLCIAKEPSIRMRDLAVEVGITERAVQSIIADLSRDGFIEIQREGRCNTYFTHADKELNHPLESHRSVSDLLWLLEDGSSKRLSEDSKNSPLNIKSGSGLNKKFL